jgi:Protein of unknown function (DUF2510)
MTDGSPTMQAGWYPDPSHSGQLRYWSGMEWSQEVQPAPAPPGEFVRPWWQHWWAIILTLFVCFPLGLIGVWQRNGTSVGVKVTISVVALLLYGAALAARAQQ